jgi:hypothetical protein
LKMRLSQYMRFWQMHLGVFNVVVAITLPLAGFITTSVLFPAVVILSFCHLTYS